MRPSPTELARRVFGDGGLFFFSTSLAIGSFSSLASKTGLQLGTARLNITLMLVGPVLLLAVVIYSGVSASTPAVTSPFAAYQIHQLLCVTASLVYSIYVGITTGAF